MSEKKIAPTKRAKSTKPSSGLEANRQTAPSTIGLTQSELNEVLVKIQEVTQLVAAFRTADSSLNDPNSPSQPGVSREWVNSAQSALLALMRTLLHQMTYIFGKGDAVVAKVALHDVCSSIVECLSAIESSTQDTSRRALFEEEVKNSFEFPCCLICFNQESKKRYNFIMKKIKLAADLPFKIAPNLKYSTQTMVAIYIVTWISARRSDSSSVYRRFAQELGEKDFCAVNGSVWESVIGFHMDYLMAPDEKADVFLREHAQLLDGFNRQVELANWEQHSRIKGPITEIPHFNALLTDGRRRDSRVISEKSLYGRAKMKVLQAARNLMKDNLVASPV